MQYTLLKGQWMTLSKNLEHGPGVYFKTASKDIQRTDIMAVEEFQFCHWEKDGTPVKSFLDIVPLKKAVAESTYLALVKCIKDKSLQVGNIVGMGFDGAANFSAKMTSCSSKTKETCSTCSTCPPSPPD